MQRDIYYSMHVMVSLCFIFKISAFFVLHLQLILIPSLSVCSSVCLCVYIYVCVVGVGYIPFRRFACIFCMYYDMIYKVCVWSISIYIYTQTTHTHTLFHTLFHTHTQKNNILTHTKLNFTNSITKPNFYLVENYKFYLV